jgi:hypothetical protein
LLRLPLHPGEPDRRIVVELQTLQLLGDILFRVEFPRADLMPDGGQQLLRPGQRIEGEAVGVGVNFQALPPMPDVDKKAGRVCQAGGA